MGGLYEISIRLLVILSVDDEFNLDDEQFIGQLTR